MKYWDKRKYLNGIPGTVHKRWKPDSDNNDNEFGPSIDHLDTIIRSASFWSAVQIVECLSFEAEFVGRWAEGCQCCGIGHGNGKTQKAGKHSGKTNQKHDCPFRGCRSAELASADWVSKLKSLMQENKVVFTTQLITCRKDDQGPFLHDWITARGRLWTVLTFKLAYWHSLPWKLCALSHKDPKQVCSAARACLQLWESNPSNHNQARRFLDPNWDGGPDDPPLRDLTIRLSQGVTVQQIVKESDNQDPKALSLVRWLSAFKHATWANYFQIGLSLILYHQTYQQHDVG